MSIVDRILFITPEEEYFACGKICLWQNLNNCVMTGRILALSKRLKKNILPVAKLEQWRYDRTNSRPVETLKEVYFAVGKIGTMAL